MFISGDSHTSVKKGHRRLKKIYLNHPQKFFLVLFDASLRLNFYFCVWLDNIYYYTTIILPLITLFSRFILYYY